MIGLIVLAGILGFFGGLALLTVGVIALPRPYDQIVGGALLVSAGAASVMLAFLLDESA